MEIFKDFFQIAKVCCIISISPLLAYIKPPHPDWTYSQALIHRIISTITTLDYRIMRILMKCAYLLRFSFPYQSYVDDPETGVKGYWFGNTTDNSNPVILYIHGGAFLFGHGVQYAKEYHQILNLWKKQGTCGRIFSLEYDLAPESPFPKPIEQTIKAYKYLLKQGLSANQICIAGDSAGGNATLVCMYRLKQLRCPLPKCAVIFSPWVNLETTTDSWKTNEPTDILRRSTSNTWSSLYLQGHSPKSPMASPIYANFSGLSPILVVSGGKECIIDDAKLLCQKLKEASVEVEEYIHPNLFHNYAFNPCGKASTDTFEYVVAFLQKHFK